MRQTYSNDAFPRETSTSFTYMKDVACNVLKAYLSRNSDIKNMVVGGLVLIIYENTCSFKKKLKKIKINKLAEKCK